MGASGLVRRGSGSGRADIFSRRDRRTKGARGTGRTVALPSVIEGVAARLRLGLVGRYRRHRPSLEPDCSLLASPAPPRVKGGDWEPTSSPRCPSSFFDLGWTGGERDLHAPDWLDEGQPDDRAVTSNLKGASRHSSVRPWRRPRASSRARAARAPASGPPPARPRGSSRPRRPRTVSDAHRASTCFIFAIRTRRGHRRRSPRTNR